MPDNDFVEEVEVPVDPEANDDTIEVEDTFDTDVNVDTDVPENVVVKEYLSDIAIGDVETLDYGEDAYVTNSGTADHPVLDFGLPRGASGTIWGQLDGTLSDQTDLQNALDAISTSVSGKADLASPAFTGTPTAPTAIADTNTNQIATTAFVKNAITVLRNYVNAKVSGMLKRMDYSNAVQVNFSQQLLSYTCPSDGYIKPLSYSGSTPGLAINGISVTGGTTLLPSSGTGYYTFTNTTDILFPVSTGDVISLTGKGNRYASILFIPEKES